MSIKRRYELLELVGRGGMAEVFRARMNGVHGFEKEVVIKRMLEEVALNPALAKTFLDEARISSAMNHPNIVQVFDYGVVDECEFIVMEYVQGLDAKRATVMGRRSGRPLSESLALWIVGQVAMALEYASTGIATDGSPLGIIHRDVSPRNVLLGYNGDVKLTDFGIAFATWKTEKTATGVVKGKLSYMAPEQLAATSVTPAVDVFALGATYHALLTGTAPHAGMSLRDRLTGASPSLHPTLSPVARELITACLDPLPANRPTAGEVAHFATKHTTDVSRSLVRWLEPLRSKPSGLDQIARLVFEEASSHRFTAQVAPERTERSGIMRAWLLLVGLALVSVVGSSLYVYGNPTLASQSVSPPSIDANGDAGPSIDANGDAGPSIDANGPDAGSEEPPTRVTNGMPRVQVFMRRRHSVHDPIEATEDPVEATGRRDQTMEGELTLVRFVGAYRGCRVRVPGARERDCSRRCEFRPGPIHVEVVHRDGRVLGTHNFVAAAGYSLVPQVIRPADTFPAEACR